MIIRTVLLRTVFNVTYDSAEYAASLLWYVCRLNRDGRQRPHLGFITNLPHNRKKSPPPSPPPHMPSQKSLRRHPSSCTLHPSRAQNLRHITTRFALLHLPSNHTSSLRQQERWQRGEETIPSQEVVRPAATQGWPAASATVFFWCSRLEEA